MRDFQREVRVLLNEQNGDAQRLIDLNDLFKNRFHQNYPVRMSHLTQARGTCRWKSVHRSALQPLVAGLVSVVGGCASLLRRTP